MCSTKQIKHKTQNTSSVRRAARFLWFRSTQTRLYFGSLLSDLMLHGSIPANLAIAHALLLSSLTELSLSTSTL